MKVKNEESNSFYVVAEELRGRGEKGDKTRCSLAAVTSPHPHPARQRDPHGFTRLQVASSRRVSFFSRRPHSAAIPTIMAAIHAAIHMRRGRCPSEKRAVQSVRMSDNQKSRKTSESMLPQHHEIPGFPLFSRLISPHFSRAEQCQCQCQCLQLCSGVRTPEILETRAQGLGISGWSSLLSAKAAPAFVFLSLLSFIISLFIPCAPM